MTSASDPAEMLSITEAAKRTGRSTKTIQRHLDALVALGAHKDETGAWRITEEALTSAGFSLVDPATQVNNEASVRAEVHAAVVAELEDERRARAVAEAVATERSQQIRHLQRQVQTLTEAVAKPGRR
jgi:predicted ArsR family transcriptional regulator